MISDDEAQLQERQGDYPLPFTIYKYKEKLYIICEIYCISELKQIMTLSKILCKRKQDSVVSSSYIWILFSKTSINWFIIKPQFEIGIVHFFSISISERYTVFLTASSDGN